MMDFARRLAPAAADASHAVAALPSRFGGDSPLRDGVAAAPADAESNTQPAVDAAPPQPKAEHTATPVQRDVRISPAMTIGQLTTRDATPVGEAVAQSLSLRELRPTIGPSTETHPALRQNDIAAATNTRMTSTPERPVPAETAQATPREAAIAMPDVARSVAPIAASPIAPRSPMSEAALALRSTSPSQPPRPVIHVTIDRIEVRAPASAPSAPSPVPQRTTTSSVSLGDYLRQRTSSRGGNA